MNSSNNGANNGTTIEEIIDTKQIKTIDALKEYLLSSSFAHIVAYSLSMYPDLLAMSYVTHQQ